MQYYLGIDIGTGSAKALAFDASGQVLARAQKTYPTLQEQNGYAEQDPVTILHAIKECFTEIIHSLHASPALIGFSTAMHSVMAVDALGHPLTKSIIWSDNRAASIANDFRNERTIKDWYQTSGVPMHAMLPLCKIKWLKENQTNIFKAASKFVGIKEYILFHLTGVWLVDHAVAAATGLLNLHTLDWNLAALKMASISRQQLPEIQDASTVLTPTKDNLFSINQATKISIGSSDGAMANWGSGALDNQVLAVTIGTSAAVRIIQNQVHLDATMRSFCYPICKDQYLVGGASNNGAYLLDWMQTDLFLYPGNSADFFQQAAQLPIGSDGLTVLPYLLGERAPIWKEAAKAVFFGIGPKHGQAHFVRAAMEAVLFNLYAIAQTLPLTNRHQKIIASGGFIQNQTWLQMLADLFELPVALNGDGDASARGAVLIGLKTAFPTIQFPIITHQMVKPNATNTILYQTAFHRFQQLSKQLTALM